MLLGSPSIETLLTTNDPAGYGGVALWHDDAGNVVLVLIYPHGGGLRVIENFAGRSDVATGATTRTPSGIACGLRLTANLRS